jgi:hypothetical protein
MEENPDRDGNKPEKKASASTLIYLLILAISIVSAVHRYYSNQREEARKEFASAMRPMMERMDAEKKARESVSRVLEGLKLQNEPPSLPEERPGLQNEPRPEGYYSMKERQSNVDGAVFD